MVGCLINLGYLGEERRLDLPKGVVKLLIVRRPVSGVPNGFTHFPMLSPSPSLFDDAQRWKGNNFNENEIKKLEKLEFDITSPDAWWALYKPVFKEELRKRGDVSQALRILESRVERGIEVYLFCYCKDLHRCHRVIVGEYLEEKGLEVNFNPKIEPVENIQLDIFNMD